MEKNTKKGISMISAVSHALSYRKANPDATNESIMNKVSQLVYDEKDSHAKLAMIAAASKAISIAERNERLSDREIINQVMQDLPSILQSVDKN